MPRPPACPTRQPDTLRQVRAYAANRSEPDRAYDEDIYLVSMDLYTQFVCRRLIADALASERARLMRDLNMAADGLGFEFKSDGLHMLAMKEVTR